MQNSCRVIKLRLLPDENIVWATQKGIFGLSFVVAFFGIIGGIFLAFFGFLGTNKGIILPPNPTLGWAGVILILAGLVYMIISSVIAKSTKYILTSRRIMETRFGKVVREISITSFLGRPLSQFLDKEAAGTVNGQPVYNIRITDPKSADFMELKSLNESAVKTLEKISQVVRCRYCNTINSALNSVCSYCGAPLQ